MQFVLVVTRYSTVLALHLEICSGSHNLPPRAGDPCHRQFVPKDLGSPIQARGVRDERPVREVQRDPTISNSQRELKQSALLAGGDFSCSLLTN